MSGVPVTAAARHAPVGRLGSRSSAGLAGPGGPRVDAGACPLGPGRRGDPGCPLAEPVHFRTTVDCPKEEIFEVCAALALAEVVLARLGRPVEAARMAAVFDLVEGRLAG
ncbi:MAG TPA: hypothetical protein VHW47_09455 [Acidimicrobiales bacterium]|nr:hypothetical protein [Acidimicrobiales bacterium]